MEKKKSTIWLTGLPCAGKTTIGKILEKEFISRGHNTIHIDGDDIRKTINNDLGFSEDERYENLRRVSHIANLLNGKGLYIIASFVSPTNHLRKMIKSNVDNIIIIYIKCSIKECIRRDTKGMYKLAIEGKIENFTGVSAPFEEPIDPDIIVDTELDNVETCIKSILDKFKKKNFFLK